MHSYLATDCGSTTTKAILIEPRDGEYRLVVRGEAPTTVEAPFEDVTRGVLNAVREIEELTGRRLLDGETVLKPCDAGHGVDAYVSTSSAGGGLQMMVAGVVSTMTAESAQRAALGAGAIVMDVVAIDDGRKPYERIARIRSLRPDMILLSGGVDGGTTTHVAELAETVGAADPTPRLGTEYELPVIYAGNVDARELVRENLQDGTDLSFVDNIRPVMERENLDPARNEIQDLFLQHVMQHAPGYNKLIAMVDAHIIPTPAAVGSLIQTVAEQQGTNVLGVDIGGATTDVFSVFDGVFNRTVSANLGMSYSVSNVLAEAGVQNVLRWVPYEEDPVILQDRVRNKTVRPTTIPQTLEGLIVEQALAREALRLALEQHKSLATGLKGVRQERTISEAFSQTLTGQTLVDMMSVDLIIGSGGVLSHAPRRQQAALMIVDAFQPEGVTRLAVDSIFMMPQLGVLATINQDAATQVFERDCLIHLGTCIAPIGKGKAGQPCVQVQLTMPDGSSQSASAASGEIIVVPLAVGQAARARIQPARGFDAGEGKGRPREVDVEGGVVGVIIDGRGRPMEVPADPAVRAETLARWSASVDAYPAWR